MLLQKETREAIAKVPKGTISERDMRNGWLHGEPLLAAMDGMLRYAKAHRKFYDSTLAEDYVMGPYFLDTIKGLRNLLNGQGVVAMEQGVTCDSKDNGVIEDIFWKAIEAAGFTQEDV